MMERRRRRIGWCHLHRSGEIWTRNDEKNKKYSLESREDDQSNTKRMYATVKVLS